VTTTWTARRHRDPKQRATVLCGRRNAADRFVCSEWIATVANGRIGVSPGYAADAIGEFRLTTFAAGKRAGGRAQRFRREPGSMPGVRASPLIDAQEAYIWCALGHRNHVTAVLS